MTQAVQSSVTYEERISVMREIVAWLRDAPEVEHFAHSTTNGVGLALRKRPMTPNELADDLERQIKAGTA